MQARACVFFVQEHDLPATPMQCNAKHCFAFQSLDFTLQVASQLHTSSQLVSSELFSPNLTSFQLLSSHLLSSQMSPAKFFSATFISSEHTLTSLRQMALAATQAGASNYIYFLTTTLEQNTPQYYFVLQSLHKVLPSTTLYHKACTKLEPVLLCTTNLAQSFFQYYFVLQTLHTALPSTTSYYKACTKHFPVLLSTTKLTQSFSQYYLVLQSLHKARPSTTLYVHATFMQPVQCVL